MILHILNGDAITGAMDLAGITGERVIWREMLSDGPVLPEVNSPGYHAQRMHFFQEEYGVAPEKYQEFTISQFQKLENLFPRAHEIVLWFEYDLFCQVNLLAALSWLHQQGHTDQKISLICIGDFPGYDRLVGLGEIEAHHYPRLFRERLPLKPIDLGFAGNAWKAWCDPDPRKMVDAVEVVPPAFPYLKLAFHQHRGRFPFTTHGLNVIEHTFLKWIEEGANSRREVVKRALTRGNIFGFGDLQFFNYLDHLNPLLEETENGLQLNQVGREVLQGKRSFRPLRKDFYLGGANIRDWCWNPHKKQLEKAR